MKFGVVFTHIFYQLSLNTRNGCIRTNDNHHFSTDEIQTAKDKVELNILTNPLRVSTSVMSFRLSSSMMPLEICRSRFSRKSYRFPLTPSAGFSCASCKALLSLCSLLFPVVDKILAVLQMLSRSAGEVVIHSQLSRKRAAPSPRQFLLKEVFHSKIHM